MAMTSACCLFTTLPRPRIVPPAAHTMASATSLAYPAVHLPRTLMGMMRAAGATPEKLPKSAASTLATLVPCHELSLLQRDASASPGSVQSGSRPSPSLAVAGSETKSYPATIRLPNASREDCAIPESSTATTDCSPLVARSIHACSALTKLRFHW